MSAVRSAPSPATTRTPATVDSAGARPPPRSRPIRNCRKPIASKAEKHCGVDGGNDPSERNEIVSGMAAQTVAASGRGSSCSNKEKAGAEPSKVDQRSSHPGACRFGIAGTAVWGRGPFQRSRTLASNQRWKLTASQPGPQLPTCFGCWPGYRSLWGRPRSKWRTGQAPWSKL